MSAKPQIIYEHDKPAFVVIPYSDYIELTGTTKSEDDEYVPFVISDYIKNPIRIARIEAGLSQAQFAERLSVTQGYISKIEGRNFKVSEKLMLKVNQALQS
jgi:ribosome-binding protein aMBF1 (putative translation factor)